MKIIGLEIYYVVRYFSHGEPNLGFISRLPSAAHVTKPQPSPVARQRFAGAVAEGRPPQVRQRPALRVLVPVRQVAGVPRGGDGGGGHLLLRRDPDVDLGLADAADSLHRPRRSPSKHRRRRRSFSSSAPTQAREMHFCSRLNPRLQKDDFPLSVRRDASVGRRHQAEALHGRPGRDQRRCEEPTFLSAAMSFFFLL